MKRAVAIRHVAFEDLGGFTVPLQNRGYHLSYHDVGTPDFANFDACVPDLLIILGGPIGAYEDDRYPFLTKEIALIGRRLAADLPTLGICLGAQLMARALGAAVYPGTAKEIGYAPIALSEDGMASPLAALDGATVLHWHGDTFDLPQGARRLASTAITPNQAFDLGPKVLGLQFHPEAGGPALEQWLVGHAAELSQCGVDVPGLRDENARLGSSLAPRAAAMLNAWLDGVEEH